MRHEIAERVEHHTGRESLLAGTEERSDGSSSGHVQRDDHPTSVELRG
jgi:hypothetical protein